MTANVAMARPRQPLKESGEMAPVKLSPSDVVGQQLHVGGDSDQ